MACLGTYEYPRPRPAQRNPYPWVELELGDWFVVSADTGAERARNSVSACAAEATRRYEWAPKFRCLKLSPHVLRVVRVA